MLPKNCPRNYSDTVLYIYLLKMSVDGIHQLMSGSYCHSSATATPQLMNSIYWQNSLMSVSEQSDVCVRTCLDSILVNLFCTFACGACLRTRQYNYKFLSLEHSSVNDTAPQYLTEQIPWSLPVCRLWSCTQSHLHIPCWPRKQHRDTLEFRQFPDEALNSLFIERPMLKRF